MNSRMILALVIELTGIAAVSAGIGIELATGAELGWVIVTGGSCLVAIGALIWGKFMHTGRK